jgi:uncharacterized protein (DUF305 family)
MEGDGMNLTKKLIYFVAVILTSVFAGQAMADDSGQGGSHMSSDHTGHDPSAPTMMHMDHSEMINSEKDFLREMIPHHQEAVDTSILLFVSTDDSDLKTLAESIYKTQTAEILEMRLLYAGWYNLMPMGAQYQLMMRDLNTVAGRERDIRYVQDMIMHHKGALEMAEKVLTFKNLHDETVLYAKEIIKTQQTEIEFMERWLKKAGVSE